VTKTELGSEIRIAGLVGSPDREGALAHLDLERGFALVARGETGPAEVIDPTIWTREKLALALAPQGRDSDPPLRRLIGAIRSLHGEVMSRPEGERPWIALLVLLLQGEDAVAVSAGDCPCFRFRSGLLSRLGRLEGDAAARRPRGSLGSESRVRIDVVPLRPFPDDLYVLSTRPLREGEVAALARDLSAARTGWDALRAAVEGASDRGRLAIRVLEPAERDVAPEPATPPVARRHAEAERAWAPEIEGLGDWSEPLRIDPLRPAAEDPAGAVSREAEPGRAEPEPEGWRPPAWALPETAMAAEEEAPPWSSSRPVREPEPVGGFTDAPPDAPWVEPPPEVSEIPPPARGEGRPWYEPMALWSSSCEASCPAFSERRRSARPSPRSPRSRRVW
jgi:hypothetical protein